MANEKTYRPQTTHWLYYEMEGLRRRVKLQRIITYRVVEPDTPEGAYPYDGLRRRVRSDILCEATPSARLLASDHGVPLHRVEGSGDEGRILKSDVQAFIDNQEG